VVGADAYRIEQAVLRWLRTEQHLPAYLGAGDGHSETVCADGISLGQLWDAAERFANQLTLVAKAGDS